MEDYNRSSHAVYRCEYHFVWVPKYRYQVLVVVGGHRRLTLSVVGGLRNTTDKVGGGLSIL